MSYAENIPNTFEPEAIHPPRIPLAKVIQLRPVSSEPLMPAEPEEPISNYDKWVNFKPAKANWKPSKEAWAKLNKDL